MKYYIRLAETSDAERLTNLAVSSESYWRYDDNFMNKFREVYRVTEELIKNNATFMLFQGDSLIGFYLIISKEEINLLEYFYIDPQLIGKGFGKIMWEHMIDFCKFNEIKEIDFVTSPQAKMFYQKLGAKQVGEVESVLREGRIIPKLIYKIEG